MPGGNKRAYGGSLEHRNEVKIGYTADNLDAKRSSVDKYW